MTDSFTANGAAAPNPGCTPDLVISAAEDEVADKAAAELASPIVAETTRTLSDPEGSLRRLVEGTATVAAGLTAVREQIERFHERSLAQEDVIERMQVRIEELQADQVRALLGPVATELATLHGELCEIATRPPVSLGPERIAKELALLAQRVESGLALLGMETVGAAPGVAFDRRWHSATRRVPTADPELDQTVASLVRQGFGAEGATRAIVMARVTVYQYDPELAAPPSDGQVPGASALASEHQPSVAPALPAPESPVDESLAYSSLVEVAAPQGSPPPPRRAGDVPLPPSPPGCDES